MTSCVLYEDNDLLVVNKPSGVNTHRPSPYTTDGIYDWLRKWEPRWESLATLHRLDKETSGVLVFGKTPLANRSLTDQFARRKVRKTYLLLTDYEVAFTKLSVRSQIVRQGSGYVPQPLTSRTERGGRETAQVAETHFEVVARGRGCTLLKAHPLTGRTHQIRIHAAWKGFPILGDELYGGTPLGGCLCLHAARLELTHPQSGEALVFEVPAPFSTDSVPGGVSLALALRKAFIDPQETDAYRVFHGLSDGMGGVYLERLGQRLLVEADEAEISKPVHALAQAFRSELKPESIWYKTLLRQPGKGSTQETSPVCLWKKSQETPSTEFEIRENGLRYQLSFAAGYSVGIFLDQRENRRRILLKRVAPDFPLFSEGPQVERAEMLNAFAYTCAFSVCGAWAGFRTTSLDLSRKYLDWGATQMRLNGMDPAEHDFIYGDAFSWCKRLLNKGRTFDLVVLDPPTFSRSRESGTFKAERDLGRLAAQWVPLLRKRGVMLVSTNCATLPPADFEEMILKALVQTGRKILQTYFATQPIDFPASSEEKAYLKTLWIRME